MKTKRFFAAILAACLTLTLALPCSSAAGSTVSREEAVQALTALGIISGSWDPAQTISRAEFVAMAVKASPGGSGVGQASVSPYPDVPRSHWASGYVEAAVNRGLVSGFSDGTFRPNQELKLAEGVCVVLGLLGYGPEDFTGAYPTGQLSMYRRLRLDRGVAASGAGGLLTRQDAVCLFYNLLSARTKEGTPYIQLLGYSLDSAGKPDIVSLINGEMEGPLVVSAGWQSALGFTPGQVYRNGNPAPLSSVQDYDVVYWNASMGTVWAYAQKVTGIIQAVEPSGAAPTAVTVAGRSYSLESSAAVYALSDLGEYHLGSAVTLLLGRSGGVAAVADISASAGERVGVVVSIDDSAYPDGSGGSYTARTVTLLATDGQIYQYQAQTGGIKEGSLVRAAAERGQVTLRSLTSASLTGRVDRDGLRLGQYPFARNAEILDVSGDQGAVIPPARLAGLTLDRGAVRWYALNSQGEIERMILDEVTGDMYRYGVLTNMETTGEGLSALYSYEFDVNGQGFAVPGTTTRFPVSAGPIQIVGDLAAPERLRPLTATQTGHLSGGQFVSGNQKYTLSDGAAVYEYRGGRYYLSSLARAESGEGSLTGWYDKTESAGGRIRVLVIRAQ